MNRSTRIGRSARLRTLLCTLGSLAGGLATPAAAQVEHPLAVDARWGMGAGAAGTTTLDDLLTSLQDRYVPLRVGQERGVGGRAIGVAYRAGKLLLLDEPLEMVHNVYRHEVFGHGARYREFGFEHSSYHLGIPFPYGAGGSIGGARTGPPPADRVLSPAEHILMKTAGIEVSNVASELLMMQWALRRRMHYREALHFLHNEADGLQYILFADPDRLLAGHDVVDYLRLLNDRYGHADDPRLTLDDLRRQTLVTLVNPLTGVALYTLLGSYLIGGEGSGAVPMINLGGDTRMLPLLRYGLTPFGPEYGLAAVAGGAGRSVRLYGRVGDGRFERSWGVGARVLGLVRSEAVTVGGSLDVGQQPGFHAGGPELEWREGGMGWGADASLAWYPTRARLGAYGRVGYKTPGFVAGEPLDRGPTLRLGISVREP